MASKYPRYGGKFKVYDWKKVPNPPACEVCGNDSVARIWMQVSYMRGDDEDFKVCGAHLKMAQDDPVEFYEEYFKRNNDEESPPKAGEHEGKQICEPVAQDERDSGALDVTGSDH